MTSLLFCSGKGKGTGENLLYPPKGTQTQSPSKWASKPVPWNKECAYQLFSACLQESIRKISGSSLYFLMQYLHTYIAYCISLSRYESSAFRWDKALTELTIQWSVQSQPNSYRWSSVRPFLNVIHVKSWVLNVWTRISYLYFA